MIKGIGPHFAKKLVKAFGEDVFDVIEHDPERLRTLAGIGPKRVERITAGWADQNAIREIMVFLQSHGVGTARAVLWQGTRYTPRDRALLRTAEQKWTTARRCDAA